MIFAGGRGCSALAAPSAQPAVVEQSLQGETVDGWRQTGTVGGSTQLILARWEQQQSRLLSCFVLSLRHHGGGELYRGG